MVLMVLISQFIKSRNEEVTESVIRRATSGMGAADSSVVSVLNSIFNPLSKKRVKELALTDDEESRYVTRLSHEIEGSGRESGIATGKQPSNISMPFDGPKLFFFA